ncbi:MAG: helix-turn-helix domain-containing protein [Bifidobacteriaceae bacterium]|nr:helix-turn-helix domain-containing protein [Bifidobacteriaceae bacterium]
MTMDRHPARPRFLTVAEVADAMRVSGMTVYRLIHGGDLRAIRVGRSFRVPEDALEEYLAAAERSGGGAIAGGMV